MKALVILLVLCSFGALSATPTGPRGDLQEQSLELGPDEVAEQHGLILLAMSRGELESGAARLAALRESPRATDIVEQLDKDLTRCRALIDLRAKHIAELIASGKRVTLERPLGKVVATVTAFKDGVLALAGSKSAPAELSADELLLTPLVRAFSAGVLNGVDPSVRGYAYVLTADVKGLATLKGAPTAEALRAESESFYKGALELGAASDLLLRLGKRGPPADVAAAKELVADLERVLSDFGALPVVVRRRSALARVAATAYPLLYDASRVLEGLSADVEKLPDGRVRLTYDFKKSRRITDFTPEHEYLKDVRAIVNGPKSPARDLVIDRGHLRLGGDGAWRHVLEFKDSISLTYSYTLDKAESPPAFFFGVHDDRAGSLVMGWVDLLIMARDVPTRLDKRTEVPAPRNVTVGKLITSTFTVADGSAAMFEDGKEVSRLDCGPRSRGGLCLATSGVNDALFGKIVIEARVDAEGLRTRWVQAKVAELGL